MSFLRVSVVACTVFLLSTLALANENRFEVPLAGKLGPLPPAAVSASPVINCEEQPGRQFCRDLRQFDNLLLNCTGNACYDLWDAQLDTIDDIEWWYDRNVYRGDEVCSELGSDARAVSQKLCSVRLTGDSRYIVALAVGYNNLLDILEDMQDRAGIRFPYTCEFQINN